MFSTYDQATIQQAERLAKRLAKRVASAEANDPILYRPKLQKRETSMNLDSSIPKSEYNKSFETHEQAVLAILRHISTAGGSKP